MTSGCVISLAYLSEVGLIFSLHRMMTVSLISDVCLINILLVPNLIVVFPKSCSLETLFFSLCKNLLKFLFFGKDL